MKLRAPMRVAAEATASVPSLRPKDCGASVSTTNADFADFLRFYREFPRCPLAFLSISFSLVYPYFSRYSTTPSYFREVRRTMATIIERKRGDGSRFFTAQIVIKRDGRAHREAKSFDRKQAAGAWAERRENELRRPGALELAGKEDPKLGAVIERYLQESEKKNGKTKNQVLRTILKHDLAEMRCSHITSSDIVSFAKALPVSPQTVQYYVSTLGSIFRLARPAWGYPLDRETVRDALVATKDLGLTSKSRHRDRRPTLAELDKLLTHFRAVKVNRPASLPMDRIILFALFSARRQEEIIKIRWDDYESNRVLVRAMKHPTDKAANDVWCELPPEASAIIDSMPRREERIFAYSNEAISAAFTRACKVLGIDDLHFHDLRHEGISRLFELGRSIPQVASVSGHRSWQSLQRYTHLRQSGDKYDGWKWA
jgi:integrase